MRERQPASVFVKKHEGGTADGVRRSAEACRDAADKRGFPGTQRTVESQRFSALQRPANGMAKALGTPERRQ
jgi:hypothetical protein